VFSTARNTQGDSKIWVEKRRGRELGREEKGEGGDSGNLVEKRRVQRGREQSSQ